MLTHGASSDGRYSRREPSEVSGVVTRGQEGGSAGPTILRVLLGAHLRRLREARGISREDAGWKIRSSETKISRMALGRVSFKEIYIAFLLIPKAVPDVETRTRLAALTKYARTPR